MTQKFKEFVVGDLFGTVKLGKYHNPEKLRYDEQGYDYICASNSNSGVNKNLSKVTGDNLEPTAGHIIA